MSKTVAEKLRELKGMGCFANNISMSIFGEGLRCAGVDCIECTEIVAGKLADMIETEQATNASKSMPLDADGEPCFLGDAVWHKGRKHLVVAVSHKGKVCIRDWETRDSGKGAVWVKAERVTHRKPDTFKSVVEEMLVDFDSHDTIELDGYFDRLRKLMGGE